MLFRRDIEIRCNSSNWSHDMKKGINGLVSLMCLNYGLDPLEVETIFVISCQNYDNFVRSST